MPSTLGVLVAADSRDRITVVGSDTAPELAELMTNRRRLKVEREKLISAHFASPTPTETSHVGCSSKTATVDPSREFSNFSPIGENPGQAAVSRGLPTLPSTGRTPDSGLAGAGGPCDWDDSNFLDAGGVNVLIRSASLATIAAAQSSNNP